MSWLKIQVAGRNLKEFLHISIAFSFMLLGLLDLITDIVYYREIHFESEFVKDVQLAFLIVSPLTQALLIWTFLIRKKQFMNMSSLQVILWSIWCMFLNQMNILGFVLPYILYIKYQIIFNKEIMKNNYLKESKLQEQKLRIWMNLQPSFFDTFYYDDNQIFEQNICFLIQGFLQSVPQLAIQLINNHMNEEWTWFSIISIFLSGISIFRTAMIIYVIIERFFKQLTYLSQYYDKDKKFAIHKQLVVDTLQLSKSLSKVRNLDIVEDLFIYFQKHEFPLKKHVNQIGMSLQQMDKLKRLTLDFRFIQDKKCINSFKQLENILPQLRNLEVLYIKCDFDYEIQHIEGRNYQEQEQKKKKFLKSKLEKLVYTETEIFDTDEEKFEIIIPFYKFQINTIMMNNQSSRKINKQ